MPTKQANYRPPEVVDDPLEFQSYFDDLLQKCAADGSHSRPGPGLRQGPGSSDLHFLGLNLKVVGKQGPA